MSIAKQRLESNINRHISDIILHDLKDKNLGHITVTDVVVSKDGSYATVYVTFFDDRGVPTERVEVLNKAKGFIRTQLSQRLTTYKTPEIRFKYDNSLNTGARIDEILKKI
ncbi:MAG: 30S ribosome-binding factor RbfA [Erysipelothrix sp.]|nr:30S ribosome-binding factor RbfA [Erysipelothrix sp.]